VQALTVGDVADGISSLALEPRLLRRKWFDGNVTRYSESHFLDLLVDGHSLLDLAHRSSNMSTALNRPWLAQVPDTIKELNGERQAPGLARRRVSLLVCGQCGDLGCGSVTALLQIGPTTVRWTELAWENGYEDPSPLPDAPSTITFRRSNYDEQTATSTARNSASPDSYRAKRPLRRVGDVSSSSTHLERTSTP